MASWFGRRSAAAAPQPASPAPVPGAGGAAGSSGVPLPLISYSQETGKFELGSEALRVLKQTRGPVGVVAVCGRARQGKSFILNQLLGRSGGFQVAPTHRPCTKGLWMWSSPVERRGPDGSKYSLVLLDTEGIDAYDQTGQYSTQIFSLAVLLSSLFVFNQMGGIDEAALDRLSLVTEMTKHIRVRASGGTDDSDAQQLASFTPAFLWLLRDFYLRLEEDGRQVTPRDYLETALQALQGHGRAVEAKNQIRESIKALFPDRDCFTLVRPVNDEAQLAQLDTLPPSEMRPEFKEGLHRLTQLIFSKAQPKRLGSQILSGPMLAGLTEAYVSAINNGAVPTIATAWQGVAEAESRRAADAAVAAYVATFKEDVPTEESALDAEHQHAMLAAQAAFDEIAIGDPEVRKANEARWREACQARFQQLRDRKLAQAAAACEKLINDATVRLAALARQEGTTVERMQEEVASFEEAYKASPAASGPTKWPRFAEFLRDAYGGAVRDLSARIEERRKSEAAAAAQAAELARLQAQQAEQRAASAESAAAQLRNQLTEVERRLGDVQAELARERAAAAAAATRVATLEQQVAHLEQSKAAEVRNLGQQAQAQLAAAQAAAQAEVAQLRAAQAEAARQAGDAQQALAAARAELAAARQQLAGLQERLAAAGAASQDASGRLAALATEKERLSEGMEILATEKAELQRGKEVAERQLAELQRGREAAERQLAELQRGKEAAERQLVELQQRMQAREAEVGNQLRAMEEEARRAAAAAAAAPARAPVAAQPQAAHEMEMGAADMAGAGEADEFEDAENLPNFNKMTMAQMKDWLMEHGHEAEVWALSQKRAKKADYEALLRRVTGQ